MKRTVAYGARSLSASRLAKETEEGTHNTWQMHTSLRKTAQPNAWNVSSVKMKNVNFSLFSRIILTCWQGNK